MRCLQCGSQLALLKKFTDGEFCSTDHRTVFYDTQQKLIIERLAESARKLKRNRLVANRAEPLIAPIPSNPEPIPAPKVEDRFPPFAALVPQPVLNSFVSRDSPHKLASGFASMPSELVLMPPPRHRVRAKRQFRLADPMPTFLSTRAWNRQSRVALRAEETSGIQPVLPKLPAIRRLGSLGMGVPSYLQQSFDKINPIGIQSFPEPGRFAAELSGFGRTISPPKVTFSEKIAASDVQSPGQLIGLGVPEPSGRQALSAVNHRAQLAPAFDDVGPQPPHLAAQSVQINGLIAVSGALRNRPCSPILPSSVALFCTIQSNPVDVGQTCLGASFACSVPEIEVLGPPISGRFFRPRPRGPIVTSTMAELERIEPKTGAMSAGSLSIPSLGAVESPRLIPAFPGRFFQMRARGAVQHNAPHNSASADAAGMASFEASISRPSYPADSGSAFAPRFLDRSFRMRPQAPLAAQHLAVFEAVISNAVDCPESGVFKPSLSVSIVGDYAPILVDRGFRARPRGPVQSPGVAEYQRALPGDSAALVSPPLLGFLPATLLDDCSPRPVLRFYRMGPKAPALSSPVHSHESIEVGNHEPLLSAPALAAMPRPVLGGASPVRIFRFFRARPRGPVEGQALAALEQISTGSSADLVSAALRGTLPAYLIGECAPNSVVRFFRARPRGPVEPLSISAYQKIMPGLHAALVSPPVTCTVPPSAIGECVPNLLVRFFRARPCAPKVAVLSAIEKIASGSAAGLISKPSKISFPAAPPVECAPSPVTRCFRPRPRGPLDGKPLELMGDAGFAMAMESVPLLAALPASVVAGLAPVQLDKPYKMRPRGPVQANQLAAFHSVPTGEAVALTGLRQTPSLEVLNGPAFEPLFLDRFYRVRPRGPVQPEATLFQALTVGDPVVLSPNAALPSMPAVLMRQARSASKDRGPRTRPPGPRPNSGTRNFDCINEGEEDTRVPQASMAGLPDGIPPDPEMPSGYLQFALPAAMELVPAAQAGIVPAVFPVEYEYIIHPPLFSAELIVDYRPSLVEIRHAFEETHKPSWFSRIAQFWSEASWDLKWAAVAAPILLGVLIHSSITNLPVSSRLGNVDEAAMMSNPLPPLKSAVDARWSGMHHELIGRAAVDLQEDFTKGLRFWTGDPNWSDSWTYDTHGGVKPGALAIYTPSIGMSDYDVEFTGEIESKSLGWVFRAADTKNYYSVKLTTIKPGPMPTVALVRIAVIDGKEGPPTQIPLPFAVSKDQVYHVRMEVSGQFFTVFVQGHVVAFWSDQRLLTGGIGFFSGKGELSRLVALRVTHQFDALGRLCASLALQDKTAKQSGVSTHESQK